MMGTITGGILVRDLKEYEMSTMTTRFFSSFSLLSDIVGLFKCKFQLRI